MRPNPPVPRPRAVTPQSLLLAVDMPAGSIRVAGELDRASARHLADALSALRSSPSAVWTLDLHGLSFCDVEGLRVLSRAVDLALSCGRGLQMTRIPPLVVELMALVRREPQDDPEPVRIREPATI